MGGQMILLVGVLQFGIPEILLTAGGDNGNFAMVIDYHNCVDSGRQANLTFTSSDTIAAFYISYPAS